MFYDKFCSIVSCSIINVIIEEPSDTGSNKFIQVFKHSISCPLSLLFLYKADEIKFLDSLVVAVFLTSGIIFCCSSLYLFYFYQCLVLNKGTRIALHVRDVDEHRDLYNGRISSLFLYLKLRTMNPSTLLAVLQLFSVCFCHLRSLVMMIPRSRC